MGRGSVKKQKASMLKTYYTSEGTLYKGDKVVIEEHRNLKIRVADMTGRIFWVKARDVKPLN